jgi:hypothetical protein
MAVSENSLDERGWPLNPALLPELKAAFRVKSCVVNGNAKEESQTIVRVHPKPKPRVCSMDASTANHFIKKQSTGDDKRRNIKSEAGKFKPVPAPRRNVPKVRQRQVSISASSMERSIEGPSIANTAIKMRTSTVNNSDSPWEDEEPDMVCTEKTQSLKRKQQKVSPLIKTRVLRKPPRKPPGKLPMKPRSVPVVRTAAQCVSSLAENEDSVVSKEENLYEDVITTSDLTDILPYSKIIQTQKELDATTKLALKQETETQEALPPVVKPRRNTATSAVSLLTSRHSDKDSLTSVNVNASDSDQKGIGQIMYNEPIIHRCNTVSESPPIPSKLPRKRREVPAPPSGEHSLPQRQCPPLPVRPRPRVTQQTSQSSFTPKKSQQHGYGTPDMLRKTDKTQQKQMNEESYFSPRPLRPRSRSSQNVTNWDDDVEEPIKRSQSLDLDSIPSSNSEESAVAMTVEGSPFYHVLDAKRESICSSESNAGCASNFVESYGHDHVESNSIVHGGSIIRRVSNCSVRSSAGRRMLWSEQPEVIESGLVDFMSEQERKLQEALFEVIDSEASYHQSLSIFTEHFMGAPELSETLPEGHRILDKQQRHVLFSNLPAVWEVATQFHEALQQRWSENVKINTVCDIIQEFAASKFDVYVKYCSNQLFQNRLLDELKSTNSQFAEVLKRLEASPVAQNLQFVSYLILPVQRITRFAILILAILERTPGDSPYRKLTEDTLKCAQNLVDRCNEGARSMEKTEQIIAISKQVRFEKLKGLPLISPKRCLLKRGPVTQLTTEKLLTRVKTTKQSLYLFVFTDLILITKHKRQMT